MLRSSHFFDNTTKGYEMTSTTTKGTVKDFFVYLGLSLVLYTSLSTLIFLCFNYIDMFFSYGGRTYSDVYRLDSIRLEVSALVILFPLLVGLSYLINKDIQKDSSKLEIRSRKWLLYSVMFVSSVSGVGDLVYLVYSFMGGDLAKEFLLKLLTILLIAGVAFAYYYQELKRGTVATDGAKVLSGLASLAVVAILGFGFYTVGLPATQRLHKQDEQRMADLYQIKNWVFDYYRTNGKLPENLEALKNNGFDPLPKDPETKEFYEYKIVSQDSFDVCGNFNTKRTAGEYPGYDN